MIEIDGTYGEGGGQIVRTALALSMLTQKPFRVTNIRRGRKNSGLKMQHLNCVRALQKLSESVAEGAVLGSEELSFYPRPYIARNIGVDIRTAGSVTLLLQSLVLPAMFSRKAHTVRLIGGTDTAWSMPIDYLNNVFLPHIRKYAKNISFVLARRGYYPKGGGVLDFLISPNQDYPVEQPNPIALTELGDAVQVKGVSHASRSLQEKNVAERQAHAAKTTLRSLGIPINIDIQYDDTASIGSGIALWSVHSSETSPCPVILGGDALGAPGKPAEEVGTEAAEMLLKEIGKGAPVDSHLQDNLVPFIALFGGEMHTGGITNHTRTNAYVCNLFLENRIEIKGDEVFASRGW